MRNIFLVLVAGLFRSGFSTLMSPFEAAAWVVLFVASVVADIGLPIYLQYRMDKAQARTITPAQLLQMAQGGQASPGSPTCDCEFCTKTRTVGAPAGTMPPTPGCTRVVVRDGRPPYSETRKDYL